MRIAIVGCGYVSDYYVVTLANHPELELVGVADRFVDRAERLAAFHRLPRVYPTLDRLLADPTVEAVVNLTNPRSHYEVSRAALEAGKHVYSEKPLAMTINEARELVACAEARGLQLAGAPCSLLGEAAQTLWKALRDGRIGQPRLAYAELDDGPIHLMGCDTWRSASGAPWPAQDELETGCTMEHAGYYLAWLLAFFGPARTVTAFATRIVSDRGIPLRRAAPDFSVGCVEFETGVVARLTCGLFGPHDHALRIIGDDGVLSLEECWDYGAPVLLSRRTRLGLKAEKHPTLARLTGLGPRRLRAVRPARFRWRTAGANRMDFSRGIAELAAAVRAGRPSRLHADFALHVNEVVLALSEPTEGGTPRRIESRFAPPEPMPWAQ
jgi:predicted dehydrogenase